MHPEIRQTTIRSLKQGFIKQSWWKFVQDEVRISLVWTIENIDITGIAFRDAFVNLFKWEHKRRFLQEDVFGKSQSFQQAAEALLGTSISGESYECGKLPTRAVLNLQDWVEPNYADIQACVSLCHQVDVLEQLAVLSDDPQEDDAKGQDKLIQLLKNMALLEGKLRRQTSDDKSDKFDTIHWDFDDLGEIEEK